MDILGLRQEIDRIDDEIIALFQQRMGVSEAVAAYKIENKLPVLDRNRELQKLSDMENKCEKANYEAVKALYVEIFRISRERATRLL